MLFTIDVPGQQKFETALKHMALTIKYAGARSAADEAAYGPPDERKGPWWVQEPGYPQIMRVLLGNEYKQNKLLERADTNHVGQSSAKAKASASAKDTEPELSPALQAAADAAAYSATVDLGYTTLPYQQKALDTLPPISTCLVPDRVPPTTSYVIPAIYPHDLLSMSWKQ